MFYTYLHRRADDGQVMYVGKGSIKRAKDWHERSDRWKRTVDKHGMNIEILAGWVSEADAFEHEKFLISCFREMSHPLVNFTDGGEGASGCMPSKATLIKRSIALKAAYACPERRLEMSIRAKALMSSPEARAEQAEVTRKSWTNPATRESRIAKCKANHALPETKKALSEISKKRWADPEFRKKVVKSVYCHTNGITYPSIVEAAAALGLNKGNLSSVCCGARQSCGGYKFSHVDSV